MEGSSGKDSGCADEAGKKPRSLRRNKGAFAVGIGRISPPFTGWGEKIGFFFFTGAELGAQGLVVQSWLWSSGPWCQLAAFEQRPGTEVVLGMKSPSAFGGCSSGRGEDGEY